MNDSPSGYWHTRHTLLVELDPKCTIRTKPFRDPPGAKGYEGDSLAVTLVCWRFAPGGTEIVQMLAFISEETKPGSAPWMTWRFPTETGESGLQESVASVAIACLRQEVVVSDLYATHVVEDAVLVESRPADRQGERPPSTEILSPPEWREVSQLIADMKQRGIRSHKRSLYRALGALVATDAQVALNYADVLAANGDFAS